MATKQNYTPGRALVIYYDGIPVGCSKTTTLETTTSTSDDTTKCDVDTHGVIWKRGSAQINSWKLTDNGLVPIQTSSGEATEHSAMFFVKAQATQLYGYATFQNGDGILVGGNVWITSVKLSAPLSDNTTYDITLDGDGPLDFIPVS